MHRRFFMKKTEKRRKKHTSTPKNTEGASFSSSVLKGLLCAVGTGAVLILAGSIAAYSASDPESFVMPLCLSAFLICCTAGGFAAMKMRGDSSGYASALLIAAAVNVLTLIVSAAVGNGSSVLLTLRILFRIGAFGFAVLGALAGSKTHSRRRRRRR